MPPQSVHTPAFAQFQSLAAGALQSTPGKTLAIPVYRTLLADHLTPVTAYERLADRSQHAFLLESVVGGERIARYSFLATSPRIIIKAFGNSVTIEERSGSAVTNTRSFSSPDPLRELERLLAPTQALQLASPAGGAALPSFIGGAVGYAAYDTVRYLEPEKLLLPNHPNWDDRHLPDLLFGLYDELVIFDHVQKTILVLANALVPPAPDARRPPSAPGSAGAPSRKPPKTQDSELRSQDCKSAYDHALARIDSIVQALEAPAKFALASVDLAREARPPYTANMTQAQYESAVTAAKEFIKAGDIFQVVLSQRLRATTTARPFDIYRALRVINPSPFMFYLSSPECILVGSSPEIMCRVQDRIITNRPLAGTRRRGTTDEQDKALEAELLADPKERAEHIMLVDLGRNDVGRAAEIGSVKVSETMTVERYSHVMHIVSNVTGKLAPDKTVFDALRLALPVGTVSGAPKIRAMQIIDELEPTKRGPYAGAIGYIDYHGNMDTCIALRTMVITPASSHIAPALAGKPHIAPGLPGTHPTQDSELRTQDSKWTVYVQAGAGIVADSVPVSEHQECINKASALLKAVALAEQGLS